MSEIIEIDCPFCEKAKIKVLSKPVVYTTQTIRVGSNRKTIPKVTDGGSEVLNDCPNCGKTKKEIEKRFKEGKKPSREEIIRRMKEAGLDPSKMK